MGWERVETTSDLTDRVDRRPAHARVRVGEVPEKEPDDVRELFQHDLLAALACVKKARRCCWRSLRGIRPFVRATALRRCVCADVRASGVIVFARGCALGRYRSARWSYSPHGGNASRRLRESPAHTGLHIIYGTVATQKWRCVATSPLLIS